MWISFYLGFIYSFYKYQVFLRENLQEGDEIVSISKIFEEVTNKLATLK